MKDKICIVTGASSGIGKGTALELAKLGTTVVMMSRDRERGEAAKSEIATKSGSSAVEFLPVDLSSQKSVRESVATLLAKYDRLHVLINNASVFKSGRVTTNGGLEMMFATNHLGPFLMTTLLLDRLKASAPARILNITAPSTVPPNYDDLQSEHQFNALRAFGATKMCNLLFTYALARRLEGTRVTVNAVHPGIVRSALMKEAPLPIRLLTQIVGASPEKAGAEIAHLASSPEIAGASGKFFKSGKIIESPAYSYDQKAQDRLWELSLGLIRNT